MEIWGYNMKIINNVVKMLAVVFVVTFLLIPTVAASTVMQEKQEGNVFLFINGGFGCHFTIINDNNSTVQAQYDIFGKGLFVNTTWHTHGSFTAAPNVWTSPPPVFVPYSFMPITAFLYTDDGQKLTRSGFSLMGFVLFFM
jgi:hypothetical protein